MENDLRKVTVDLIVELPKNVAFSMENMELWAKSGRLKITDYIESYALSKNDFRFCFKVEFEKES